MKTQIKSTRWTPLQFPLLAVFSTLLHVTPVNAGPQTKTVEEVSVFEASSVAYCPACQASSRTTATLQTQADEILRASASEWDNLGLYWTNFDCEQAATRRGYVEWTTTQGPLRAIVVNCGAFGGMCVSNTTTVACWGRSTTRRHLW